VARAALNFPALFECLADGRLSVTTASALAPHLRPDNAAALIEASAYRSRQEILQIVSSGSRTEQAEPALALDADVQASSESVAPVHAGANREAPKSLADATCNHTATDSTLPPRRGRIVTTGDGDHEVRLRLTQEELESFHQVRDLLAHAIPSGDPALVYARAMQLLRSQLMKRRFGARSVAPAKGEPATESASSTPAAAPKDAASTCPDSTGKEQDPAVTASAGAKEAATPALSLPSRSTQRHQERSIPIDMRSFVWKRDGGRCAFVSRDGHRCDSGWRLEFDHIIPIGMGGRTEPDNLRLLCRAHNQYEARGRFGADHVNAKREQAKLDRARAKAAKQAETARAARRAQSQDRSAKDAEARSFSRTPERQARHDDVRGALRGLGFREDEAKYGAALADDMPEATLEACLRVALRELTQSVRMRGERLARCSA
jgi:hypothetical protein